MKAITSAVLLACALALAPPASAGRLNLSRAVKICEAEFAKMSPPVSAHFVADDSRMSETHLVAAFKMTTGEGRLEKMICTVDRQTGEAVITPKPRPNRKT